MKFMIRPVEHLITMVALYKTDFMIRIIVMTIVMTIANLY